MTFEDMLSALAGGALIGLAAGLLLWFNGRIAGISGILNGAIEERSRERYWRLIFVGGLIIGAAVYAERNPGDFPLRTELEWWILAIAGLLVGFGTRMCGGCTSGHGVCGISRLSMKSIVATAAFIVTGMISASVTRHLLGVAS